MHFNYTYGKRLRHVKQPSQLIILGEGTRWNSFPYWDQGPAYFANADPNRNNLWSGHSTRANYLMTDGHTEYLQPTATASPVNLWTVEADGPLPPAGSTWPCLLAAEAYFLQLSR